MKRGHTLFSPDSTYWKVNRETLVALAAPRAVLMEIAHPLVAEAVFRHSNFRRKGLARLYRTAMAAARVTFGTPAQAEAAARRIAGCHAPVSGALEENVGTYHHGHRYSATDADLMFWVLATLIDTNLRAYDFLVEPLSLEQKEEYYQEARRLAALLEIPASAVCPTYGDFARYMEDMVHGSTLHIGSAAQTLREALFPRSIRGRAARLLSFIGIGMLPANLRQAYGLDWNDRKQERLEKLARMLRSWRGKLPDVLLVSPFATVSEWRIR